VLSALRYCHGKVGSVPFLSSEQERPLFRENRGILTSYFWAHSAERRAPQMNPAKLTLQTIGAAPGRHSGYFMRNSEEHEVYVYCAA